LLVDDDTLQQNVPADSEKRPSGFGRGSLRNIILKTGMSASPDQKSSASTSRENSGSRSVAIFQLTCASVLLPSSSACCSSNYLATTYSSTSVSSSAYWSIMANKILKRTFRVAIDFPFNVVVHARLIGLLVHQHMVRDFADRVIADATASVSTDTVCADAFSGAVRPTLRNRRGGSRSARFSVCYLVLVQRVSQNGAMKHPEAPS
jgi:hypothetical protein